VLDKADDFIDISPRDGKIEKCHSSLRLR